MGMNKHQSNLGDALCCAGREFDLQPRQIHGALQHLKTASFGRTYNINKLAFFKDILNG